MEVHDNRRVPGTVEYVTTYRGIIATTAFGDIAPVLLCAVSLHTSEALKLL